jgi:hypothetical protein
MRMIFLRKKEGSKSGCIYKYRKKNNKNNLLKTLLNKSLHSSIFANSE